MWAGWFFCLFWLYNWTEWLEDPNSTLYSALFYACDSLCVSFTNFSCSWALLGTNKYIFTRKHNHIWIKQANKPTKYALKYMSEVMAENLKGVCMQKTGGRRTQKSRDRLLRESRMTKKEKQQEQEGRILDSRQQCIYFNYIWVSQVTAESGFCIKIAHLMSAWCLLS